MRTTLLLLAGATALVAAIGCSGGSSKSRTCDARWQVDSAEEANNDFLYSITPTGTVTTGGGAVSLAVNGSIGNGDLGVLYSKRLVTGDFDATIRFDRWAASTTGAAMLFTIAY